MVRKRGAVTAPLKPLAWYKKLADKKGRLEAGAFLIEGHRAVRQVIDGHPDDILEILTLNEPLSVYRRYPVRVLTGGQLRSISQTTTPQGTMAVVLMPVDAYSGRLPEVTGNKILLLEDIQDPGNTGTLIRSAAAFDFSGVIMTEKCADPFSPKVVQSTAGAILSVWVRSAPNYLELAGMLKKKGFTLVAAELEGESDHSVLSAGDKLLLALGNEAAGLSRMVLDMADYRVRVPTVREKAESLNVAVCGAICMYLASRAALK